MVVYLNNGKELEFDNKKLLEELLEYMSMIKDNEDYDCWFENAHQEQNKMEVTK